MVKKCEPYFKATLVLKLGLLFLPVLSPCVLRVTLGSSQSLCPKGEAGEGWICEAEIDVLMVTNKVKSLTKHIGGASRAITVGSRFVL